jgi:5-methylcytosine-specific restriction endonuclease McrA
MPNWQRSTPPVPLPADWPLRKARVLQRDFHRCQYVRYDTDRRCLAQATEVDHIIPRSEGGSDDESNLRAICEWHHLRKTGSEGGRASARARQARRDAAPRQHPGLIDGDEQKSSLISTEADDDCPF